jgi:transposase
LIVAPGEREALVRWSRRRKTAQALALRARIALRCAEGLDNIGAAEELGVTKNTVGRWRRRFVERRLDGLLDEPRPGAPRRIQDQDLERVLIKTLEETPRDATHWSTRSMARASGLSSITIHRIWHEGETEHPPAALLTALAEALGVTTDELLGATPLRRKKAAKTDSRLQRRMRQIERMNPREKRQVLQILDALIEREQLRASKG